MRKIILLSLTLALAGCASGPLSGLLPARDGTDATAADGQTRPQARDDGDMPDTVVASTAARPPAAARTVEEFDTTSAEERQAAASAAPSAQGERSLGTTVASLGDVASPGFWLETPLVDARAQGRVVYPATGKSAQVELRPIDGPPSGGSRISLAAMRLIEAPLTDLPTLEVYVGG